MACAFAYQCSPAVRRYNLCYPANILLSRYVWRLMMSAAAPLVAIVNNDAAFAGLLDTLLRDDGCATLLQQIGDLAYESIKQQPPRLIILDISSEVPHESWRVVDLLLLDPATATIPVIVCA